MFFAGFLKVLALGVALWHNFLPQRSGFHTFFVPGVGKSPFQKIPQGFARRMAKLGLTDT